MSVKECINNNVFLHCHNFNISHTFLLHLHFISPKEIIMWTLCAKLRQFNFCHTKEEIEEFEGEM